MEVKVKNLDNKEVGQILLADSVFTEEYRADILHRVVQWQLAKRRSGCHDTKERAEVSFSTRKIYRQKGTGRARHGSRKAPIFVGGGTVFGPTVRSHAYSLNKKIRALGLKVALAYKLRENSLTIIDELKADSHKTSAMQSKFKAYEGRKTLVIDESIDQNIKKGVANISNVNVLPLIGINVYDLLKHQEILITKEAVKKLELRLAA